MVDQAFTKIEKRAQDSKDKLATINPVDAVRANILKGINALESELLDGMRKVGLTSGLSKVFDLKKAGASDEQLAKVKELAEMAKNVDIAFGNVKMPPFETFDRSVKGLDTLLKNGRITVEQYNAGIAEASQALIQATGISEQKSVGGALKDSQEAVSAIIKAQQQDLRQDPQQELIRAQKEAQEIRKKQLAAAEKLVELIEEQNADDEFEMV